MTAVLAGVASFYVFMLTALVRCGQTEGFARKEDRR